MVWLFYYACWMLVSFGGGKCERERKRTRCWSVSVSTLTLFADAALLLPLDVYLFIFIWNHTAHTRTLNRINISLPQPCRVYTTHAFGRWLYSLTILLDLLGYRSSHHHHHHSQAYHHKISVSAFAERIFPIFQRSSMLIAFHENGVDS